MLRSSTLTVGLVLVCVFVAASVHSQISPDRLAAINISVYPTPCPVNDMPLRDLKGNQISLGSLKGSVVLLNFWKIECPPCAQEKPLLEGVHRKHAAQGLSVLAVNLFDDQNRIREYVRGGGFTYTFASDPDQRLRVRTQTMPSGMPACFVVNPKAEAIYEISMVPTTYLIDREGRIVARASGMVNWGHPDAQRFIESLLGPRPMARAEAPVTQTGTGIAASVIPAVAVWTQTGSDSGARAEHTSSGAPRGKLVMAEASAPSAGGDAGRVKSATDGSSRLPFQGSASTSEATRRVAPRERTAVEKQPSAGKTRRSAASAPLVKPSREGTARSAAGSARQVTSPLGGEIQARGYNLPARQAQGPAALGRSHEDYTSMPRQTGSSSPLFPGARGPAPATLPPATRYIDPDAHLRTSSRATVEAQRTARTPAPPIMPDSRGYVTARVPAGADRSLQDPTPPPASAGPSSWQYPTPPQPPTGGRNPIVGFVLDAFSRPEASQAAAPQPSRPTGSAGPASVIFNPLQQLGAGIKDTVSRIIPGR